MRCFRIWFWSGSSGRWRSTRVRAARGGCKESFAGLWLRSLVFHRFQLAQIQSRNGRFERRHVDPSFRGHDEPVAENDAVLVVAADFRRLLVRQPAIDRLDALGAGAVVALTLYADPASKADEPADAAAVRDLQRHGLAGAPVRGFCFGHHETGDPVLVTPARRFPESCKGVRHEGGERVDTDRIDTLAAADERSETLDGCSDL